jgi:hypothetical protein
MPLPIENRGYVVKRSGQTAPVGGAECVKHESLRLDNLPQPFS